MAQNRKNKCPCTSDPVSLNLNERRRFHADRPPRMKSVAKQKTLLPSCRGEFPRENPRFGNAASLARRPAREREKTGGHQRLFRPAPRRPRDLPGGGPQPSRRAPGRPEQ